MELDKKDIYEIHNCEPARIEHMKLEKYAQEEYSESAFRVKVDGAETKYCWCSICKSIYSADKKHLMGNIRTHWNGHRSRKRVVQNTLDNFVSKKLKISISESEIAEFRRCAAQALCESALPISFFESAGAQTLFDAVQSKFKFLIIGYESYMYLELLKLNDDVRKTLTPSKYYMKCCLEQMSANTKDIIVTHGKNWAENGRLSVQVDHWVPKNCVIASRQILGIMLVVRSPDFKSQAKTLLSVMPVRKKTHLGKLALTF